MIARAALVLAAVTALLASLSCAAATAAAAKDPMKCERDPNCKGHQAAFDCSTQCSDDPGCLEHCNEIQEQTGTSAPH
jgi:hypothetical protein